MATEEYPLIIAIDFDHTICKSKFPELGPPIEGAADCIRKLNTDGHHIIIWTCRYGEHEEMVKEWLKDQDIPYDYINQHHPVLIEMYGNDTRKISADIYIDDKNIGGLPPWDKMYDLILKHKEQYISSPMLKPFK